MCTKNRNVETGLERGRTAREVGADIGALRGAAVWLDDRGVMVPGGQEDLRE